MSHALSHPFETMKGQAMRKKVILLIISVVITLFFLVVSICQFWQAYVGQLWGNAASMDTLIAAWTSLFLGLLGLCSFLLICRSDPAHL